MNLGASKWEFRHGSRNITAKIEDQGWLLRFQGREVDVRPGDALRCIVQITNKYGHDNELLSEQFVITQVEEVLTNQLNQGRLFEGE